MAQRMPDIDPRQLIASNLSAAQAAIDEGRYIEPSGSSALQYFNTVLTLDPANTAAKMGIDRIASHFADGAAAFITEGRFAEAVSALQSLRRVQPEHSRLTLLEGQLRNALKQYLPRPPDIATAGDAQSVPAAAPRMAPQKSPEVPRVKPQNAPTREAAPASQGGMLINARQAIARGQLDVARKLIGAARHMGVAPSQLVELDQALGIAEQDRAKSELLQLAAQRTAENRLLEPAQDSAKHYLQQLAQADARFPGLDKGIDALGGRLLVNAQAASDQKDFDLAARFLAEARVVGFATGKVDAAEAVLRNALAVSTASSASTAPPAPSADPVLVKVVEPQYPGEARLRGIEGWVDISFVVTASGDVTEPRVENSSMKHLFARPAINAVRQWKYQPRPVTGQSPAERMQVRVQFQLK